MSGARSWQQRPTHTSVSSVSPHALIAVVSVAVCSLLPSACGGWLAPSQSTPLRPLEPSNHGHDRACCLQVRVCVKSLHVAIWRNFGSIGLPMYICAMAGFKGKPQKTTCCTIFRGPTIVFLSQKTDETPIWSGEKKRPLPPTKTARTAKRRKRRAPGSAGPAPGPRTSGARWTP